MKTYTNGNIIVEDIQKGDIHFELEDSKKLRRKVLTKPQRDKKGLWYWKSIDLDNGSIIEYMVKEGKPQYTPYLFDNENCEE